MNCKPPKSFSLLEVFFTPRSSPLLGGLLWRSEEIASRRGELTREATCTAHYWSSASLIGARKWDQLVVGTSHPYELTRGLISDPLHAAHGGNQA